MRVLASRAMFIAAVMFLLLTTSQANVIRAHNNLSHVHTGAPHKIQSLQLLSMHEEPDAGIEAPDNPAEVPVSDEPVEDAAQAVDVPPPAVLKDIRLGLSTPKKRRKETPKTIHTLPRLIPGEGYKK